jgi:hypothetical protein
MEVPKVLRVCIWGYTESKLANHLICNLLD